MNVKEEVEKLLQMDLTHWQAWFIVGVAIAVGCLVFFCGFQILKKLTWGRTTKKSSPINALISDADAKAPPRHGLIVWRWRDRVHLLVDDPADRDAVLSLRSTRAPAGIPWVQVAVVHCRAVGKNYLLECDFVERPPWNVVVWFG